MQKIIFLLLLVSQSCFALYDCVDTDSGRTRRYQSSAPCDTTFMPVSRARPYVQNQAIEIPFISGHYRVDGAINQSPVSFVVDTGATITTVSQSVAQRLGVVGCQRTGVVVTANGSVSSCISTVREITFGSMRVQNVEISVLPAMSQEALLGMNVLGRFAITQDGQSMRISTGR